MHVSQRTPHCQIILPCTYGYGLEPGGGNRHRMNIHKTIRLLGEQNTLLAMTCGQKLWIQVLHVQLHYCMFIIFICTILEIKRTLLDITQVCRWKTQKSPQSFSKRVQRYDYDVLRQQSMKLRLGRCFLNTKFHLVIQ